MAQNRGADANTAGQQAQIVLTLLRTLLGDGQGSSQIHPPSERRAISPAIKSATDKERRDYLNRLILEEQQKQKDAGDSDYQY
jgi:hypothetical protein